MQKYYKSIETPPSTCIKMFIYKIENYTIKSSPVHMIWVSVSYLKNCSPVVAVTWKAQIYNMSCSTVYGSDFLCKTLGRHEMTCHKDPGDI